MQTGISRITRRALGVVAAATIVAACAGEVPMSPAEQPTLDARVRGPEREGAVREAVAALRRATDRYHNLDHAIQDSFVLLHACEVRPGEGPVGAVYVNLERLMDGVADPTRPDALVYEPRPNGAMRLVAAEFAIPYALWNESEAPDFLGHEFQREDEFGVFGLHVWVWRKNPNGLFEEANPLISCGA